MFCGTDNIPRMILDILHIQSQKLFTLAMNITFIQALESR